MSSPEVKESIEDFSERVVFEWHLPLFIGALATVSLDLANTLPETMQAGIGAGVFVLLHKALQKLDLFEYRRDD